MAIIQTSDAQAISKEFYASGAFHIAAYEKNPGMGTAKKVKFTGKYYDFALQYGYSSNRSRAAATALAKANKADFIEFNVPTIASYNAKDIDQKAMAEVKDEGAFVDLLTNTIEGIGKDLGNGVGEDLYNSRGAWIGRVGSSSFAVTTITLLNPSHVTRFYVGQVLRVSANDGLSGSLRTGTVTLTGVNRDTGELTASGNWSTGISAIAQNDYIFPEADFGIGRAGLQDWVPDSTSGLGTAFYGATRSADATRLAGCRQPVSTGADIVTAMRSLLSRMGREEADPDTAYMSWDMVADLETQIETKTWFEMPMREAEVGFEAVKVTVGGRRLEILPDRSCPDDRIYVGKRSTLELIHSQGEVVKMDDTDGEILSRNATTFSYDMRASSYSNYVVRQPMQWGVVVFS